MVTTGNKEVNKNDGVEGYKLATGSKQAIDI